MASHHADEGPPPYAEEWLAAEAMAGGRNVVTGSISEMTEAFNAVFAAAKSLLPPPDDSVATTDHKTAEGVLIREYIPADLPANAPTGLYIHSGGWCLGSIEHEDHLTRALAKDIPARLISVEYRLAPQHPFPAALEDCLSAWRWIIHQPHIPPTSPLFIHGGSAGGNLTLATTLAILQFSDLETDTNSRTPTAIFPSCPSVCVPQAWSSLPLSLKKYHHQDAFYADAAAINRTSLQICSEAYLGKNNYAFNPLISPIFHSYLAKLHPVYLTTSDKDPLHDDAEMLQYKLKELGKDIEVKDYKGYPHFFHAVPVLEATKRFHKDLVDAVRKRCGSQS